MKFEKKIQQPQNRSNTSTSASATALCLWWWKPCVPVGHRGKSRSSKSASGFFHQRISLAIHYRGYVARLLYAMPQGAVLYDYYQLLAEELQVDSMDSALYFYLTKFALLIDKKLYFFPLFFQFYWITISYFYSPALWWGAVNESFFFVSLF